jgi:hypothetical protein
MEESPKGRTWSKPMLPVPVNPHWYQAYWMTEHPPHHRHLTAVLRWLGHRLTASHD